MGLEEAKEEFEKRSETKDVWINNSRELHVRVEGRTYPGISEIKENIDGLEQITHEQSKYTGEIRHYVFVMNH